MKLLTLLALLITLHTSATGQDSLPASPKKNLWIQYNPFTLFEPEVPLTFTLLYQPADRFGFSLEAGIYLARREELAGALNPMNGFRLRPAAKYYFGKKALAHSRFYLCVQGLFKQTFVSQTAWINVNDSTGMPLYSERKDYREKKTVFGLNCIAGLELIPGSIKKRWMIDIYSGLGARAKFFSEPGLSPEQIQAVRSRSMFIFDTDGVFPALSLGVSVGYRIF